MPFSETGRAEIALLTPLGRRVIRVISFGRVTAPNFIALLVGLAVFIGGILLVLILLARINHALNGAA
jgi:hypothetical protein